MRSVVPTVAPPLPAAYDVDAIAAHFATTDGAVALRERAAFIAASTAKVVGFSLLPAGLATLSSQSSAVVWSGDGASAVVEWLEGLGPTAIKFGQAAANRPDLVGNDLANELRLLQDACEPFDRATAERIIREELPAEAAAEVLAVLPATPVAAASLGQVYKLDELRRPRSTRPPWGIGGVGRGGGGRRDPVALKLLRPGARRVVAMDSVLARSAAAWLESLTWGGERLIRPALVAGVDEFFSRLFEEMDYTNEAQNLDAFGALYGSNGRAAARLRASGGGGEIVVPRALRRWSGASCLAMTWLDGEKLLKRADATLPASELPLVRFGIEATLSQMLEQGVMHADPHGGNLLRAGRRGGAPMPAPPSHAGGRVRRAWRSLWRTHEPQRPRLAYLDFGLMSRVPEQVRDGLVCAVAQILFARNAAAVADLFDELMLLPADALETPGTREALQEALENLASRALVWPDADAVGPDSTATATGSFPLSSIDGVAATTPSSSYGALGADGAMPTLEFGALITELALLAPRFALELPPYFLNNARALATLEGMAKSADPSFDVLQAVYPFALRRLLADPRASPVVRRTLDDLTRDADGRLDLGRVSRMLDEAARLSKRRRWRLVVDAVRTPGGRALARDVVLASAARVLRRRRGDADGEGA